MPRRPRAAAAVPADAQAAPPAQTPEVTPSAAATPAVPAPSEPVSKPRRTRRPKVETAVAAEAIPPPAPSKTRRGRRKSEEAVVETAPATEETAPVLDVAPVHEPPTPRRRGRSPKAAETAVTETPSVAELPPTDIGGAGLVETAPAAEETAAPVRRRGRPRKAASAAPIAEAQVAAEEAVPAPPPPPVLETQPSLPDVEAPIAEETALQATTRPVNLPPPLRQRRGRQRTATSDAPVETVEMQAPAADEIDATTDAAPAEEGTDTERRGRRGRRTRRRRTGEDVLPAESGEDTLLVAPEPVSAEVDDEPEEAAEPLPLPSVPVFVAPLLVPPAQAPPDGALLPRINAHVTHDRPGLAQIVINDVPHAPFFFFVNAEEATDGATVDRQIADAAANGIHLFSSILYLPFQNAYGVRSFGAADALVQQILTADPNAYILPRVQCVPTNFWARTHPQQLARYADGTDGDVSLASSEFWADCVDALDALIAHFADPATPGGERVVGFHLDRGEWFYDAAAGPDVSEAARAAFGNWLHVKYQQPYRMRAAWVQNGADFDTANIPLPAPDTSSPLYAGPRDGRWRDYHLFASELVAQAITGLAEAVKVLSGGRYLTAVSYGYTLEFAGRPDSGHLALAQVLQSPHIDILAGPNSYTGRGAGGTAAFGAPVDSVAAHGKLWLVEDDTKTFLAEAETPDTYNPKITSGSDTQAAHQRAFGAALAHRAGVTWMDLWGQGWLDEPGIWVELGDLTRQAERWASLDGNTPPDVAVFVDEASLAYMKGGTNSLGQTLVVKTRELLLKSGASVHFYLQSDLTTNAVPDAKLYLFVNALRLTSAEKAAVQEKLQVKGKTLAWLYAPGVFDEQGLSATDASDAVGITLRPRPWNARGGSQLTDAKHPLTERLRGGRRTLGQDDVLNPSYAAADPDANVLAEYAADGGASVAVREHPGGWKSVFLGDPHLSPELLRGLYAYAGVPMAGAQDDVTHAADGVLLVHAPFTGQRLLALPRPATVYDVMEDRILATDVRAFRTFMRARTTRLFLWGDTVKLLELTGLALPDGSVPAELNAPADDADDAPIIDDTMADTVDALAPEEAFTVIALDEEPLAETQNDDASSENDAASSRRSRWQRRRAALRARRDAERAAVAGTVPAAATLDPAALLPDLPPRRVPDGDGLRLPDGGGEDAE